MKVKGLFRRKKKKKHFEGVLEEDDMIQEPVAVLKGRLRTPASLQSQAGMGKTKSEKVKPVAKQITPLASSHPRESNNSIQQTTIYRLKLYEKRTLVA